MLFVLPCFGQDKTIKHKFVKPVSRQRIEQFKTSISRRLTLHKVGRIIVPIAGVASSAYVLYKIFYGGPSVVPVVKKENDLEKLGKRVATLEKTLCPRFLSWNWLKGQVYGYVEYVAFGALTSAGLSILNAVYHDDTIEWFVKNSIHVEALKKEIEQYSKKNKSFTTMTDEQFNYYSSALTSVCKRLVIQVEYVAAFMEYQLEQFKSHGVVLTADDLLQVPHVVASANNLVQTIQSLTVPKKDMNAIANLKKQAEKLFEFAIDFDLHIKRFSSVEKDLGWRVLHG